MEEEIEETELFEDWWNEDPLDVTLRVSPSNSIDQVNDAIPFSFFLLHTYQLMWVLMAS